MSNRNPVNAPLGGRIAPMQSINTLPVYTVPDHNDEPSCPQCGHYNAMLQAHQGDAPISSEDMRKHDVRKCRDCGTVAKREN